MIRILRVIVSPLTVKTIGLSFKKTSRPFGFCFLGLGWVFNTSLLFAGCEFEKLHKLVTKSPILFLSSVAMTSHASVPLTLQAGTELGKFHILDKYFISVVMQTRLQLKRQTKNDNTVSVTMSFTLY